MFAVCGSCYHGPSGMNHVDWFKEMHADAVSSNRKKYEKQFKKKLKMDNVEEELEEEEEDEK